MVAASLTINPVAFTLKFASKTELGHDYVVPPLEGLWWAEDMAAFTTARDKTRWSWTLLLFVPEWLGAADVDAACATVREKATAKSAGVPPRLDELRLLTLDEGRCAQTLHVGPYDAEGPVLEEMHSAFIPEQGYALSGTHHEIYLGDPRRAAGPNLCPTTFDVRLFAKVAVAAARARPARRIVDPFARRQLALGVLVGDAGLAAALPGDAITPAPGDLR